ncbi:MAG: sulfite exporter TauE/SafE family protein [Armatimonadetes bacterium]|nr:sulfite exporter TauE/SafE family protein [Armatimonadota bacterium]
MLALSSFGLGALHALEPGHGKTVVGAYLIGSRGRISDAVLLGVVVTLTHSGSVILLGILSTVAAAYFVPDTVQKVLEVVSGLLVVGVGGWMLRLRIRQARGAGHDDQTHDHNDPSQDHRSHEHPHDHSHENGHSGHSHSHVPQVEPGERPTLWQLITLGVSGGIVPCPAALAVLLAAVSYGQFVRGLSLVIIFSIGMAVVLVAIGIAMVKAASFAGKYVTESKWTRIVPVISAAVITCVGIGLSIKAVMDIL